MTEYQATPDGNTTPMGQEFTESQAQDSQGSGYVNMSKPVETPYQQEQNQRGNEAEAEFRSLQEKLGVDLSSVQPQESEETPQENVPQEKRQPTQEELAKLQQLKQQVDFVKKFNTKEGQRFRNEFKDYLGIDPLEAFQSIHQTNQAVQQLAAWKAQQENERAVNTLKQEWGEEFEPVWTEVRERFNTLPQHMRQSLDNLDGARLLAAQIRMEKLQKGGGHVPRFDKSANSTVSNIRSSGAPGGYIRTSDFFNDKVSEAEYVAALKQGRVIKDM